MKIVQSLWFNNDNNQINYNAGWLDVKYHLMSWSLSCLSLKKHVNSIELITDSIGSELLIDKLALPYTSVSLLFDTFENPMAEKFWALKKVYAYSVHNEPFIFVDGDVFNFSPTLINTDKLVSQNFEKNFSFYHPVQMAIKETCAIANSYLDNKQLDAINTGIIGGGDYTFFRKFKDELFEFAYTNEKALHKIVNDYHIESKYVNVWLEQYFLQSYAQHCGKDFLFYLDNQITTEDDYRLLADFTKLPSSNDYLHLMHLTKINPTVCEQLAQRLFIESPETYERVETVCRQLKSTHHFIANSPSYRPPFSRVGYLLEKILDSGSLPKGLADEFQELQELIDSISNTTYRAVLTDALYYENSIIDFKKSLPSISVLKEKWQKFSIDVNNLFSLPESIFLEELIKRSSYCVILESEWNWAEHNEYSAQLDGRNLIDNLEKAPSYYEVVLYIYLHENIIREQLLDALNMLILEAVDKPTSISSVIQSVCDQVLAYQSQMNKAELADTILSRIRHFLYHGVLEVVV